MSETKMPYDLTRKRPLELRIRDLRDQGGISEEETRRVAPNRLPADALYVARVMIDEGKFSMQQFSLVGDEENSKMGLDGLFQIWVALGGHIVREAEVEKDNADQARKKRFIAAVLMKLKVDAAFLGLKEGMSPEEAVATAKAAMGTPVDSG